MRASYEGIFAFPSTKKQYIHLARFAAVVAQLGNCVVYDHLDVIADFSRPLEDTGNASLHSKELVKFLVGLWQLCDAVGDNYEVRRLDALLDWRMWSFDGARCAS